jgi:hypothetical protein
VPEALERRDVPSRLGAVPHPVAQRIIPTVGALGDSYTDEYRTYNDARHSARNWVELLAMTHRADFGPFSARSLGPPRDQGYLNDWALSGATSDEMVQQQLPGLTAQVASGQVQVAWVFIGADDLLYDLQALATTNSSSLTPSSIPSELTGIFAHIGTNTALAVDTLLAANPSAKVVVATLPDVGELPIVRQVTAVFPQAQALLPFVTLATQQYDAQLKATFAGNPRVAIADFASLANSLSQQASGGSFAFGGTTIDVTQPSDNFRHLFLADGIHIGTIGQGLLADLFLRTIDTQFGYRVPLLSPWQIVALAARL